ncbi:MAG: class I SAM-dependent methyltransferase [candidate division KSB1 bacterium]|nr:class I SAM-dependent methyltransferase [candidate division KSB1 bacterium]
MELRQVRRLLAGAPETGLWLDVGCGDGSAALGVGWTGLHVGVDWSFRMAQRAKARGIRTIVADASHLPLVAACADLLTAVGLTEYVADQPALWREMERVLRRGGTAVVTISPPGRLNRLRALLGWRLRLRTRAEVEAEWERSGFQVVEWKGGGLQEVALLRKRAHAVRDEEDSE